MKSNHKILKVLNATVIAFFTIVIVISVAGILTYPNTDTTSTFYVENGIAFSAIMQVLLLSFLMACINAVFDNVEIFSNIRMLYQILLRLFFIVLITILFIYIFGWFSMGDTGTWFIFIVVFLLSFMIACGISVYITKKKDKEYEKLITQYKAKRGE